MNGLQRPLKALLTAVAVLQLGACSKTVQWEEEVPLNTGTTIWVKRSTTYARSGAHANPLKPSWRIESETLKFDWAGKSYKWEGDASLMLLAISPAQRPVLVADADQAYRWHTRHNFNCVVPFYVQFVPDATGHKWTWPPAIEPWLYQAKANLKQNHRAPDEMPTRVTRADRAAEDADILLRNTSAREIVSTYVPEHCKGKI